MFGRQRIEVSVRAGSTLAVVAGTLVDLGGTAELDSGVLYVPRKLRDAVLAADEPKRSGFALRASGDELAGLVLAGLPLAPAGYRVPDGPVTWGVDQIARSSPGNPAARALSSWWHDPGTQAALAGAEGGFWNMATGYFDYNEPVWAFLGGAGDSFTAGATEAFRALETWAIGAPRLDKDSALYKSGVGVEMGLELLASAGSMWLKREAARLIAEHGTSAVVRRKVHAPVSTHLRRAVAAELERQAGKKVAFEFHHIHPLFGHIGGQKALFPTGGLPASMANGAWNMVPVIGGRAAHMAEHRSMAQMERWLAMSVNRSKAATRLSVAGAEYSAERTFHTEF